MHELKQEIINPTCNITFNHFKSSQPFDYFPKAVQKPENPQKIFEQSNPIKRLSATPNLDQNSKGVYYANDLSRKGLQDS